MNETPRSTKLSSNIGGMAASATTGGYSQGLQFAATKGGSKPGSSKDLRGGDAAKGGYKQGPAFAASAGGDKPGSHKDLRGGNATTK